MTSVGPIASVPGPIRPEGASWRPFGAIVPPSGVGAVLLVMSACMPSGPEARREAYLDCARDQGLTVVNGTIRTTTAADLRRLDACQALPR